MALMEQAGTSLGEMGYMRVGSHVHHIAWDVHRGRRCTVMGASFGIYSLSSKCCLVCQAYFDGSTIEHQENFTYCHFVEIALQHAQYQAACAMRTSPVRISCRIELRISQGQPLCLASLPGLSASAAFTAARPGGPGGPHSMRQ